MKARARSGNGLNLFLNISPYPVDPVKKEKNKKRGFRQGRNLKVRIKANPEEEALVPRFNIRPFQIFIPSKKAHRADTEAHQGG